VQDLPGQQGKHAHDVVVVVIVIVRSNLLLMFLVERTFQQEELWSLQTCTGVLLRGRSAHAWIAAASQPSQARHSVPDCYWCCDLIIRYFLEDHEAEKLLQAASKVMDQVQLGLELCGLKCSECYQPCLLPKAHTPGAQHDCLHTDHQCGHGCGYCQAASLAGKAHEV